MQLSKRDLLLERNIGKLLSPIFIKLGEYWIAVLPFSCPMFQGVINIFFISKSERVIKDKSSLVEDINLLDTKLYKHREEARGRAEFKVDDAHGGYALEREQ